MTSISVADFRQTIIKFVDSYDLPLEVKRMALKEVYDITKVKADAEIYQQAAERENKHE